MANQDQDRTGGEPAWIEKTPPEAFEAWARDAGGWQQAAIKQHRRAEIAELRISELEAKNERLQSAVGRLVEVCPAELLPTSLILGASPPPDPRIAKLEAENARLREALSDGRYRLSNVGEYLGHCSPHRRESMRKEVFAAYYRIDAALKTERDGE